jgi:hypothetical protein
MFFESEIDLQRYICTGCKAVDEEDGPRVMSGTRFTRAAFDLVGEEASAYDFSAVAGRVGVHRDTVANIWNSWIAERLDEMVAPPVVLLRFEGRCLLAIAGDGSVASAFSGTDDPRLSRWTRATRLLCTPEVALALHGDLLFERISGIRRRDIAAWSEALVPAIVDKARTSFDRYERAASAGKVEDAILLHADHRSPEQDVLLEDACRTISIRNLRYCVDTFRSIWTPAAAERARRKFDDWAGTRTQTARDWFSAFLQPMAIMERLVFDGPYTEHDRDFPSDVLRIPRPEPREDGARRAGRCFALNNRGPQRTATVTEVSTVEEELRFDLDEE